MNDFYTDEQLEELFGLRPKEGIVLFGPMELGWVCPVDPVHEIVWSEFEQHIWCYECNKDYFSLLCPKQMNPFTTKAILGVEMERMLPEMEQWTIGRYRDLVCEIKDKPYGRITYAMP